MGKQKSWKSVLSARYQATELLKKEGKINRDAIWYSDYTEEEHDLIDKLVKDILSKNENQ